MKITRRTFLTSLGGVAAGTVALRGFGQSAEATDRLIEEWSNYEEEFQVTICRQCPGGCGVLARVVDDKLVALAGNPFHPVNQGALCMKGLAGKQVLNDPDRIQTPLKRHGERGAGKFKAIGWEEALAEVSTRLRKLRSEGKPHTLAILGGQYRGQTDGLIKRFCQSYGTPNYLRYRCLALEKATPAQYFQQGLDDPLCFDLANSNYILSFGCNLLESWNSTVNQLGVYSRIRQRHEAERARLVHIDCRQSITSIKANQWIPINPGTDGALALGLAYIIIHERIYDGDYIEKHTFGFDDWEDESGRKHLGFKNLVLGEYPPERVSEITGVPVGDLFGVARGFANTHPAVALGERGPPFHSGDLYTRMAIHSLNALVGSIGVKGGAMLQGKIPLTPWAKQVIGQKAKAGLAMPRLDTPLSGKKLGVEGNMTNLAGNIVAGKPYQLDTLFLYYSNPLFSMPESSDWGEAIKKVPYIVSFSPFMDETSQQADLILPDHTYLERWQDDQISFIAGQSTFSIGKPPIAPLYNTRQTEDVLLQLAHSLGASFKQALPWNNYEELLKEKAEGLFKAKRGYVAMSLHEEAFESVLAKQGYWEPRHATFDEFWADLLKKGAWLDPYDYFTGTGHLFKTRTLRFEFFSQNLRDELVGIGRTALEQPAAGEGSAIAEAARILGLQRTDESLFLPHFEEPRFDGAVESYPFHLNTYRLMSTAGGRGGNQPWLQQQPAVHLETGWESWVEINPAAAGELGISENDMVWIESEEGKIRVKAKLSEGVMPDVVNLPFGQGHKAYGRWARNRGANPNEVIGRESDRLRGLPVWGATRVRLIKA